VAECMCKLETITTEKCLGDNIPGLSQVQHVYTGLHVICSLVCSLCVLPLFVCALEPSLLQQVYRLFCWLSTAMRNCEASPTSC